MTEKQRKWAEEALKDLPELLSERHLESINFRSADAFRNDRWSGNNLISYIKIGKNVRYRKQDVIEFLERNTVHASK